MKYGVFGLDLYLHCSVPLGVVVGAGIATTKLLLLLLHNHVPFLDWMGIWLSYN